MEKFTISRDDAVYEAFADVVKTANGVLICTYRESEAHYLQAGDDFPGIARVVVRRSLDGGLHWGPRQVVCATEDLREGLGYNGSRLLACRDGSALLVVDRFPRLEPGQYVHDVEALLRARNVCNVIFRSTDDGATWTGPEETSLTTGIVPSITELRNGDLLVGLSNHHHGGQLVHRSEDGGRTWTEPVSIAYEGDLDLSEGDFVELDDGTVALYMREDREGFTGWRSLSRDAGRTWSTAERCFMMCCRGRPGAGLLSSGEIFITYRFGIPGPSAPRMLMMYVETQEQAAGGDAFANPASPDMRRLLMLDVDRCLVSDTGYSGWTELDNGDVLVVNYINDDAPRAHIRGYIVSRRDWMLVPPGRMPWVGKGQPTMDAETIAASAEVYRQHRARQDT